MKTKISFLAIFVFALLGCINFENLTNKNKMDGNIPFQTNGFYYRIVVNEPIKFTNNNDLTQKFSSELLFFYLDNSSFSFYVNPKDSTMESVLDSYKECYEDGNCKKTFAYRNTGIFSFNNNRIINQVFVEREKGLKRVDVIENHYKMLNKTTMLFEKNVCNWCQSDGNNYQNTDKKPIIYKFCQSSFKPDSSTMSFKKESWYRK